MIGDHYGRPVLQQLLPRNGDASPVEFCEDRLYASPDERSKPRRDIVYYGWKEVGEW